ncbi:MAG: insulinase family protein [Treponema sp.]|nr:insulinase family protein [Treponema sp.]
MNYFTIIQKNRKYIHSIIVFFAIFVLFSCAGGARAIDSSGLGRASDPVPFMEEARTGILPSGLRYYLLENPRPEGRAFLTLAVDAGSVLETDEERGLAHFVEHMAFNGTARFAKSELVNYLRSLGMRFGPEVNAYTSFDETVYGIEVPVEIGQDGRRIIPEKALAVIDDWTSSILFNPDDVDSERLVIMEEYRTRLGAGERISREIFPMLFRGSPYAERLPIGIPEIIETAPTGRLEGFYKRWYRPENMAIIIVGDFDAAYLETTLEEHFPFHESWKKQETAPFSRPRYNLSEPKKGSLETLIITDSELTQTRVDLYWKRKAEARRGDLAYYRESIIDYLAHTSLSLRFQEAATKSSTPYAYAGAGMANYGESSRFYILVAIAKTGAAKNSLSELLLTKESLTRYGFTADELDTAKISLLSSLEQMVSEKDRQPSNTYIDSFTRHFLTGETMPDIDWELEAIEKLLPGITLKELNKKVKSYFADDDLSVIISAPEAEKDSLPGKEEIAAMTAEARKARIARPAAGRPQGELLRYDPEPGMIIQETTDEETGALRLVLSNGMEVILKETLNKNNEISLYAQARGGSYSVPDEMAVSAELAAEMLNVSGLGSFSLSELTKILSDKQVSMSFWNQGYLRGFQGSAAVKDIKVLMEMIHLVFTEPRLDPEAVTALLDQMRSKLAFEENDPNSVFGREISRTIFGNSRFHSLTAADLERADTEDALAYIEACLNPGDYTFVFTGNLDLPQLRSLIETYLASIPEKPAFNEWTKPDPMRPSNTEKEIRKGKEERSTVYLGWFNPSVYSEERSAAISVLSEYLDIQLTEEIRETLGGVYSISPWVSLSILPLDEISGGVYFYCDPKRAVELSEAVKEEIMKIGRGNIDKGIYEKAIEALVRGHEEQIQSNLYISQSYANSAVIYHSPLSRLNKRPALYRAVSIEDIQKAAEELLEGSHVRLILYPEL